MALPFPDSPFYRGHESPCRFEAEIYDCIVYGKIPDCIDGTFYRVMPDAQFAPKFHDDVFINGDGQVDAFRIRNGHVDFKQKFVRTQKFITERAARRSVYGKYRNRYTDEELVKWMIHSTANTHIFFYNGVLLALKEDSPPYALDPNTLKTIGLWDFGGKLPGPTFTAHPKIDGETGNMYSYGYEAKGDASTDICFYASDPKGNKIEECWVKAPYTGMIHDCAISKNWIIFILLPLCVSLDRLKQGGKHFMWDSDLPMCLGLLPRHNPKSDDIRWYPYTPESFIGHIGNAFDVDEWNVYLDTPLENGNVFGAFFPTDKNEAPAPGSVKSRFVRFHIDTRKKSGTFVGEPEELLDFNGGMPRIDDRYIGMKNRYTLLSCPFTPKKQRLGLTEGGVAGRGFANSIGLFDNQKRSAVVWWAGDMAAVGEPVFCPRSSSSAECDGYVMTVVARMREQTTELVILDVNDFMSSTDEGETISPVARIVLPFRLRSGIHGSWVPASDLGEWKQLCDMDGVDEKTMQTFGDKVYHGTVKGEILKGHERPDGDHHGGPDGHFEGATVVEPHSREWAKTLPPGFSLHPQGWVRPHANGVNGFGL